MSPPGPVKPAELLKRLQRGGGKPASPFFYALQEPDMLQDIPTPTLREPSSCVLETVFLIENNHTPIGAVGIDWREPEAPELGYWLGVEHWGQGFGTEAARAVIDFTFEEFDVEHLISGARVTNPSSRNILEKCGFQWSGVELHRFEELGSSTPVDRFRLSRSVWSSLKNWNNSTRHER